jgi:hypothetical protein
MLDMLRRFEEGAAEGEDVMAALEAEEEDEDDLAAALDGIDLGELSVVFGADNRHCRLERAPPPPAAGAP